MLTDDKEMFKDMIDIDEIESETKNNSLLKNNEINNSNKWQRCRNLAKWQRCRNLETYQPSTYQNLNTLKCIEVSESTDTSTDSSMI